MSTSHTFNSKTNAVEVSAAFDNEIWKERVVMITGTTHGIGFETLRGFAEMKNPPTLIVANRNPESSKEASKQLEEKNENLKIHHVTLDLSSLQSVHACVSEVKNLSLPINILVLNAGVFISKYERSAEGYEKHFAINHLGHFVLTNELIDVLHEGAKKTNNEFMSRVVVVASHSHKSGEIDFRYLPLTIDTFGSIITQKAYAQSKLCNVLFANELNRRMIEQDLPIRANSLHPASMTNSNLGNDSSLVRMAFALFSYFTRTLAQAAATTLYCSLADEIEGKGGEYFDACAISTASEKARDVELAKKLWEASEQLATVE